ncbi:MAG TPA: T9SS type A sorting domain-containing protein, partial [Bacteroidia bacterium]|nr:T9SS type A sorting domain-containing protein [Bacteroidia bacterium]
ADPTTFWHTGMYANNGRKSGIYSFQITTTCLTDVHKNEKAIEPELSVFQSGNNLMINTSKLPSNEKYTIQLFEISGKNISEKSVSAQSNFFETTIEINGLAAGTYLVRVGTVDFQRVKKVVIQ